MWNGEVLGTTHGRELFSSGAARQPKVKQPAIGGEHPAIAALVVQPSSFCTVHTNSKLLFQKFAAPIFLPGMRVLEIGPDMVPSTYRRLVETDGIVWHTLDLFDAPDLTYPNAGLYSFPIPDRSYDVVLSGQVIEHVAKIWRWMPELARVTVPGGRVVTIAPVSWPYHEVPIDCWRLYPEAFKALCEESSLAVENLFCGSLELPHFPRAIPGRSPEFQPKFSRLLFYFLGWFGFPVEKAFDTICIARKGAGSRE